MEYTITVRTSAGYEYPVMALCDTVEQANNLASKIVRDVKRWSSPAINATVTVSEGYTSKKEINADDK